MSHSIAYVNTNAHAFYAKTTVYHQGQMRKAIREAIEWPGFAFVDITSADDDVPWGEVVRRLPDKRGERPLFGTPEQAFALYSSRLPHYRMADVTVRPAGLGMPRSMRSWSKRLRSSARSIESTVVPRILIPAL